MKLMKCVCSLLLLLTATGQLFADEGMWVMKELNKQNLARMAELGFVPSIDKLYSETDPCVANAVVIFGGGCTGITVSETGLIFTNHHCGYGAIQQLSSVEHDYLKNGFVSQSQAEELPVPGLSVRYLHETVDVSDRINSQIASIASEKDRLAAADSIGNAICDSIGWQPVWFRSITTTDISWWCMMSIAMSVWCLLPLHPWVSLVAIPTTGCGRVIHATSRCSVSMPMARTSRLSMPLKTGLISPSM